MIFAKRESIIRPLNPADQFTLAMDEEIRKEGMPGSLCGFGLNLETSVDQERLQERIGEFCARFPTAQARLRQLGRRFYWCHRERPDTIFFVHACSGPDPAYEIHRGIVKIMNQQCPRDSVNPIEFHLFQAEQEAVLFLRWLHPFCDAVGVSLIIKFLTAKSVTAAEQFTDQPASLVREQLAKFSLWRKFKLMTRAKRLIERTDRFDSILATESSSEPKKLNFKVVRLTEQDSRNIAELSRQQVGMTATSLYYVGCLMRAIERIQNRTQGEAYCVPYAFNLRRRKACSPVTGNQVSALFAQAPREIVQSRERLFQHLRNQYRETLQQQLDFAFLPLMWAAQWMSLGSYGKTLRQSYRSGGERSSFWFSDIGETDLHGEQLFGAAITGMFHACQLTTPPGFGLLACVFQDRLSLSYNFVEPLIGHDWIERLNQEFLNELLGGHAV